MKALLIGAMLCALTLPALAFEAPASPLPGVHCVPYAQVVRDIKAAGGEILGERTVPFTRNGTLLYYTDRNVVLVAGIVGINTCVFLPAAVAGHLGFDARDL